MVKCILQSCCYCISLRRGTIIIGALCIINSIAAIITVLVDKQLEEVKWPSIFKDLKTVQVYTYFMDSLAIVMSVLMLIGVRKRKWRLMIPWLVFYATQILIAIALFICLIKDAISNGQSDQVVPYIAIGIASVVFSIYIWFVPFSYSKELIESDNERRPLLDESEYLPG